MGGINQSSVCGAVAAAALTAGLFGSLAATAASANASSGVFQADPGDRDDFCEKAPFQPVCDNGPADPGDMGMPGDGLPGGGGQMVPNIDGSLSLPGTPGAI